MDDNYRRLNIFLKIYLSYIKFKLKFNSKLNKMHAYVLLNENNIKKLEDEFLKEGYYISNGYADKIKWKKDSRSGQTTYTYLDGTEIIVNDGNTHIEIQPKSRKLEIK